MTRRFQVLFVAWRQYAVRWSALLLAILFLFSSGMILFSPILTVRSIEVTRKSPRLDIEQVQQALAPMFGRRMLFLPSFEVTDLLKQSIPDLRSISVSKAFPSTLQVSVELDPLSVRLRIADPDAQDRVATAGTGARVDFLTAKGVYVQTSTAQEDQALPDITLVDWGVRPQPGTLLITSEFLQRMSAAEVTLLRQFGQEVKKRVVYLRAQEFHLLIDKNIALWFDLKSPLENQVGRYRTFLKEVGLAKAKEYVDLRVQGRVIYK